MCGGKALHAINRMIGSNAESKKIKVLKSQVRIAKMLLDFVGEILRRRRFELSLNAHNVLLRRSEAVES